MNQPRRAAKLKAWARGIRDGTAQRVRRRDGAISLSVGEVCLADAISLTKGAFDIRSTASRRKAARAKMEAIRSRRWSGVSSPGLRNSVGMGRLRREWAEEKQVTLWRYLLHMPSRAGWSGSWEKTQE
jgi:hypothetical protein